MLRRIAIYGCLLLLLLTPAGMAQDSEIPTIAVLRWASDGSFAESDRGFLDMLQAYGFISGAERLGMIDGQDVFGEKLTVLWRNADRDAPTANIMMEEALDRGADVVFASGTSVARIAVNATTDLDNPPAVLFNIVAAPYSAGIAQSSCVKPAHVSGVAPQHPFEELVKAALAHNPDLEVIGTYVAPGETQSLRSERAYQEAAEALGLSVQTAPVNGFPDVPLATQTLLDDGVDAIAISMNFVLAAIPAIVNEASAYDVPVYSPIPAYVTRGAVLGVGFNAHYQQGIVAAQMAIAYLNGEVAPGEIGIAELDDLTLGVNFDVAAEIGLEVASEYEEGATFRVRDGEFASSKPPPQLMEMSLEERMAADAAFLESLRCTEEMIAEQQAALEAGE